MKKLVIIDYGHGNANSIKRALQSMNIKAVYSNQEKDILSADWLIFPGVGHFKPAIESLQSNKIIDAINHKVIEIQTPVLGICLGFQIMASHSEEGYCKGLKWINTNVKKIDPSNKLKYKVPHIGWRTLNEGNLSLLKGIAVDTDPFYFCHKFYVELSKSSCESTFTYDKDYVGLYERDNIFGVQFHPEKSHSQGLRLLENFLKV
jgi:glutamine amidotransferase